MDPINTGMNNPNFSPEVNPVSPSPEQFNSTQERQEVLQPKVEQAPVQNQVTTPQITQFTPLAQDDSTSTQGQEKQATTQSSTPETATDADRIDQEWVNKVKEVISQTVDDPHAQQKEISHLMAEYVLKRFGRQIGEAD